MLAATYLVARCTRARLDDDLAWADVFGLALLTEIGFTVCLLLGELAFGAGSHSDDHVKVAVLTGSLLAALLAAVVLRLHDRTYRRVRQAQTADRDVARTATRTWPRPATDCTRTRRTAGLARLPSRLSTAQTRPTDPRRQPVKPRQPDR